MVYSDKMSATDTANIGKLFYKPLFYGNILIK